MTSKIILKKSSVAAKVPVAGDLEYGELALNYTDGILYYKNNVNAVAVLNPTGGGGGSGTVTSVAALTLGTTGTDVSSTVANSTTTPVITLNLPTASATNRGLLSSADWTTFNNKQPAGSYLTTAVTSLSFGTTGLTPNTGTTGAITVAGTLVAANGGTGLTSPGASGNVLTSNGTSWVSSAPTGGGGGITYTTQTANYTAAASQGILANTTSGSFTVTLPATPTTGASVIIADPVGTWSTNSLIVARNGSTISGLAEDITLDLSGAQVTFIYNGTTWGVYAQVGGNGGTVITNSSTASLTNKTLVDPILTLTGTQGTAGQIPLSQGSSQPPVWSSIKTINSVTVTGSGNIAVQPTLVSGTSIKTINSTTLLGSGDLAVQPTLVSGTNIKSINGVTLLGSGDLVVTAVSATGTATVDFGAFPGTSSVDVVVTGQTLMSATARIRVFINGDDTTTDHNTEDHRNLPLFASFVVGAKVAGTGFTIYSRSLDKLQGTFKITWEWTN